MENFKSLTRLRVLNLANNRIEKCENLRNLQNLVELNLQGNLISIVVNFYFFFSSSIYFLLNQRDIEKLPIQRLFLNFNKIRRYDDIRCIAKLTALKYLTLEGERLISEE